MSLALNSLTAEEVLSALESVVYKPISVSPTKQVGTDGSVFPLLKREDGYKPLQSQWSCMLKLDETMLKSSPGIFVGAIPEARDLVDSIKTKLTQQLDLLIYPPGSPPPVTAVPSMTIKEALWTFSKPNSRR